MVGTVNQSDCKGCWGHKRGQMGHRVAAGQRGTQEGVTGRTRVQEGITGCTRKDARGGPGGASNSTHLTSQLRRSQHMQFFHSLIR